MQQWENEAFLKPFSVDEDVWLKGMGLEGWELTTVIWSHNLSKSRVYYFKRPIPQPSTADKIFNKVKDEVEGGHMEVKTTS